MTSSTLSSTLCGFAALSLGLAACGTDAEARFAGLSKVERGADTLHYRLHYPAPPWKRRDGDALVTGATTRVQVGGGARTIAAGSGSVLEIGSTTVANVPGENFPKYRLEAALLTCSDDELTDDARCAHALFAAEQNARGNDAKPISSAESAYPHFDVLSHDADGKRNQRIAFFDTPDAHTTLWVYMEGNPPLDEEEVSRLLGDIEIVSVEAP